MKNAMRYEGQNTSSIFARCECGQFLRLSRNEIALSDGSCQLRQPHICSRCKVEHDSIEGMVKVLDDELQREESKQIEAAVKSIAAAQVKSEHRKVRCKHCRSDQISASPKGFGLGKAVVGGVAIGPFGLLAGFLGSRKTFVTCLNCGHRWVPGSND